MRPVEWIIENKTRIAIAIITLIVLVFFLKPTGIGKLLIFATLTIITGIISYYLAAIKSPIDVSPAFFFMIIISAKYGFVYSIIFLILAVIIPSILGGDEMTSESMMFLAAFAVLTLVSGLFLGMGIVIAGIVTCALLIISGYFINNAIGNPTGMINTLIHAGVTIVCFIALGKMLIGIM